MSAEVYHIGAILVIEDDPDVRDTLEVLLTDEGHNVTTAPDGLVALDLVKRGAVGPDLILADYNLPNGMDGARATALLREAMHRSIPAIMLTGDISTGTLRNLALQDCIHLTKPMKLKELTQAIQRLLPLSRSSIQTRPPRPPATPDGYGPSIIFVVDDDDEIRPGDPCGVGARRPG
jgi:two-component system CheB/CheR fusion protein